MSIDTSIGYRNYRLTRPFNRYKSQQIHRLYILSTCYTSNAMNNKFFRKFLDIQPDQRTIYSSVLRNLNNSY